MSYRADSEAQIGVRLQCVRGRVERKLAVSIEDKRKKTYEEKRPHGKHTTALAIRISTAEGATLDTPL